MASNLNRQTFALPADLSKGVETTLDAWQAEDKVRRLWSGDASVWTNKDESKWLGWLRIVAEQERSVRRFPNFSAEIKDAGFAHVLLIGMGGSSLCPEVFSKSFGKVEGAPSLHVLDSTDPAQIKSFENKIDLANTLFIVSSKSGTTLEPNILKQYFFERVKQTLNRSNVGDRFIAITDPGSKLRQLAESEQFRKIFLGVPSIGGRYSALSDFGLAPAAAMGVDVEKFLGLTSEMVDACGEEVLPRDNPGVILGAVLGAAYNAGRDKVVFVSSPDIKDLGAWLEQLIAESTGKNGRGLIPVDREPPAKPADYGDDRIFVYLRLSHAADQAQDETVELIRQSGQPLIQVSVDDVYHLGQEFFRWEMATAVAGSIIGINPFDQPDVEASKVATRKLTERYEETGSLPSESPFFETEGLKLFADPKNTEALNRNASERTLREYLKAHLDRINPRDYFAQLAYVEMNEEHRDILQLIRSEVCKRKRVATCLGFGPRFLHSTGQAYKGGPNSGVFLQITADDENDLAVPEQKYTFGIVKAAQARGDFEVLSERGRRALRVHLGKDVSEGLDKIQSAVNSALTK